MALIGNYSLQNRTPSKQFIGGVSSGYPDCIAPSGSKKDRQYGGYDETAATPNGYLAPGAWVLPMKPGSMSSYTKSSGVISTLLAQLYMGQALSGTAAGSITVTNAQLDQIVALVASGMMTMLATNGGLTAAVELVGSGTMMIAVSSAELGGIFGVSASGSMSLSVDAYLTALANMEAEAGGPTPLSPEALAAALLDSLLVDYNEPGSVGEALNNVGAGSNPWSSAVASNNDPGSFGELQQKLLTLSKYLGLK